MSQNLYCKDQRSVTKEYREGYDAIQWDTDDDETPEPDTPDDV